MADTTVSLGLDMSDVAKALARLPEMTSEEAEKAVRAMTRAFDKASTEAKKLRKDIETQAKAYKTVEDAAGKAGQSSAKLAGILGLISPELAEIARTGNDVGDALEVAAGAGGKLGPMLAVAAAGVAVLGGAYVALQGDIQRASEAMQLQADIAGRVEAAHRELEAARIDLAVASGDLTEAEGAQEQAMLKVQAAVDQLATSQRAQRKEMDASTESAQAWLDRLGMLVGPVGWLVERGADEVFGWSDTIEANTAAAAALDKELKVTETVLTATAKVQGEVTEQRKRATDATQAAEQAERGMSAAYAESLAVMAEYTAASQASGAATAQLTDMAARAAQARMTDLELLTAQTAAERERAEAIYQTAVAQATSDSQRLEASAAFEAATTEILATEAERRRELVEQAAAEATAYTLAQTEAYMSSASTLAGSLASVLGTISESLGESNREAATAAFAIGKAAALSQVVIDTAMAVSSVNAAWAAVPPVAAALSAAAIAVGAAQGAAIAAEQPAFHVGGMNYAPDETGARLLRGEGVLSRAAVDALGGASAVNRLNRGDSGGGQSFTLLAQYGHRTLDAVTYDAIQRPGSPLRVATRAGRRKPGRRS